MDFILKTFCVKMSKLRFGEGGGCLGVLDNVQNVVVFLMASLHCLMGTTAIMAITVVLAIAAIMTVKTITAIVVIEA